MHSFGVEEILLIANIPYVGSLGMYYFFQVWFCASCFKKFISYFFL